ncbi:hypothetical protein TPHV1_50055 [Treponema phagedenis]|uniref:Uncharacterized protein n=1 Tax=Treponema phagedenis TaxID=162 RepID=A0A0B7H0M1_TREPH|nr:hypothetical protein TPHV1_50055 [Treponema phagedenis]
MLNLQAVMVNTLITNRNLITKHYISMVRLLALSQLKTRRRTIGRNSKGSPLFQG